MESNGWPSRSRRQPEGLAPGFLASAQGSVPPSTTRVSNAPISGHHARGCRGGCYAVVWHSPCPSVARNCRWHDDPRGSAGGVAQASCVVCRRAGAHLASGPYRRRACVPQTDGFCWPGAFGGHGAPSSLAIGAWQCSIVCVFEVMCWLTTPRVHHTTATVFTSAHMITHDEGAPVVCAAGFMHKQS